MTAAAPAGDPYKDLNPEQRSRVEQALAKAKKNGVAKPVADEPAPEPKSSAPQQIRRKKDDKQKLRASTTKYQVCEPLAADDLEALRTSMLARGIQVPVVIDREGFVIDGHNRVHIAVDNDLDIPMVAVDLFTDEEKRALAWELNRARRQMSREQKDEIRWQKVVVEGQPVAEVAKQLGESEAATRRNVHKQAEQNIAEADESGANRADDRNAPPVLPTEKRRAAVADKIAADPAKSDRAVAKETGVDKNTVSRTRKKLNEGKPVARKEGVKPAIAVSFAAAVFKLDKAMGVVTALSEDGRFARSASKLGTAHLSDLEKIDQALSAVMEKL